MQRRRRRRPPPRPPAPLRCEKDAPEGRRGGVPHHEVQRSNGRSAAGTETRGDSGELRASSSPPPPPGGSPRAERVKGGGHRRGGGIHGALRTFNETIRSVKPAATSRRTTAPLLLLPFFVLFRLPLCLSPSFLSPFSYRTFSPCYAIPPTNSIAARVSSF